MLKQRHCPSCGKEEEKDEFIQNFCPDCFSQRKQVGKIPDEIEVKRCAVCGRIFHLTNWIAENKKILGEIVSSKIRSQYPFEVKNVALQASGKNSFDAIITIEFTIDEKILEQKLHTLISFNQTQCIDCSRETGGFYNAIIQLRPYKEEEVEWDKLEKKMDKLVSLLEKMGAKAVKIEKTENGFDLKVVGISEALSAARKISLDVTHTRKLVGRKQGKYLYRHTFCVRV